MQIFIALLRGINVGGSHRILMKDLKRWLEEAGLCKVATYIQSGNVVFQTSETDVDRLAHTISAVIQQQCDFKPQVLILSVKEFQEAIDNNPFPDATTEPKSLHFYFLKARPSAPDLAKLESLKTLSEAFKLVGNAFYLHAPDGIGRSKLAEKVEKMLGVPVTARNWRSVEKIMSLARAL